MGKSDPAVLPSNSGWKETPICPEPAISYFSKRTADH